MNSKVRNYGKLWFGAFAFWFGAFSSMDNGLADIGLSTSRDFVKFVKMCLECL